MIDGKFEIVGGKGEIVSQNIRPLAPGEVGYELLEVKLKFDANGDAECRIPYVSGQPSMWGLKIGTGGEAPALPFTVAITGALGELLGLSYAANIASQADVAGNVNPVSIVAANAGNRPSGPITITTTNSDPANAGKTFTVALQLIPPARSLTA